MKDGPVCCRLSDLCAASPRRTLDMRTFDVGRAARYIPKHPEPSSYPVSFYTPDFPYVYVMCLGYKELKLPASETLIASLWRIWHGEWTSATYMVSSDFIPNNLIFTLPFPFVYFCVLPVMKIRTSCENDRAVCILKANQSASMHSELPIRFCLQLGAYEHMPGAFL